MAEGAERRFAPVGSGILDFPAILRAAKSAGVTWGIVEQDDCYGLPPLQAVRASLDYLKRIAIA
jgi:sugar phosphate isomerase/epimerase